MTPDAPVAPAASSRAARRSADDGVQVVELAVVGGVLALLAVAVLPLLTLLLVNTDLGRAAGAGLRFATKVQANPCVPGTAGCPFTDASATCPALRRRPSASEVEQEVRTAAADRPGLVVGVSGDPCRNRAGTAVTVVAAVDHDLGRVAGAVNRLAAMAGADPVFASPTVTLTATATGIQE